MRATYVFRTYRSKDYVNAGHSVSICAASSLRIQKDYLLGGSLVIDVTGILLPISDSLPRVCFALLTPGSVRSKEAVVPCYVGRSAAT